ncbi:MAG: hypothetical protein K0S76_492 [Herbinix sp.]|jgi:tetratricopeptide (TPR) repeat protein|nr:hypothetical protein [Herbinix sp.]
MESNYTRKFIIIIICAVIGIIIGGIVANFYNKDVNEAVDVLNGQSKFMSQYGSIYGPDYYSNKYSVAADIGEQEAKSNINMGRFIGGICGVILGLIIPIKRDSNQNYQVDNAKPEAPENITIITNSENVQYEQKNNAQKELLQNTYNAPPKESPLLNKIKSNAPTVDSLLKRAELFLEDGDFELADKYFDRVLDLNPECSKAYIGRLLVEFKVKSENELENGRFDIALNGNYKKAMKFASVTYKEKLVKYTLI